MTKEDAKHFSEVLKAYSEGKNIQWSWKNCDSWNTIVEPWSFGSNIDKIKYRVKPEPKYRPYASAEEFLEAQKEHGPYIKSHGQYFRPIMVDGTKGIVISDITGPTLLFYPTILETKLWQDGHRCGILKETV